MTPPRHRFGAHYDDLILVRQLDQLFEGLVKLRRLHVICIAAKRGVLPAGVEGIACRVTQTAEFCHVPIAYARGFQRGGQGVAIELRIVP